MGQSLGMETKIDETHHVASCCCPSYAHEVLGKIVSFIFPTLVKWKGRRQTAAPECSKN